MKACPYCAEQIQDEAIVCRFCNRSLTAEPVAVPAAAPVATKKRSRPAMILIAIVVVGVVGAWYMWATSAYSYDLATAKTLVASLENDQIISLRTCNPNRAAMPRAAWEALATTTMRTKVMAVLGRVCVAEGGTASMIVRDQSSGAVLGSFNGWSMDK